MSSPTFSKQSWDLYTIRSVGMGKVIAENVPISQALSFKNTWQAANHTPINI